MKKIASKIIIATGLVASACIFMEVPYMTEAYSKSENVYQKQQEKWLKEQREAQMRIHEAEVLAYADSIRQARSAADTVRVVHQK